MYIIQKKNIIPYFADKNLFKPTSIDPEINSRAIGDTGTALSKITFCLSFIVVLLVVVPPALGSITIGNTLTSESLNLNTSDLGQNLTTPDATEPPTPDATEPPTPDATEPTPFVDSGVTFLLQM